MPTIYPSLLGCNMLTIAQEIALLDPYCIGYHVDIMDNHFAPNLGFSFAFTNAIANATKRRIWVHLMINKPELYLDRLELPTNSIVTVHHEAITNEEKMIQEIRRRGWAPSIALSPKTRAEEVIKALSLVDQILVMGVKPGFAGQTFMPETAQTIDALQKLRLAQKLTFRIGMDGGITKENIGHLAKQGVDDFAVAHAIFGTQNHVQALQQLQKMVADR